MDFLDAIAVEADQAGARRATFRVQHMTGGHPIRSDSNRHERIQTTSEAI
jgi:hypothetical protein